MALLIFVASIPFFLTSSLLRLVECVIKKEKKRSNLIKK